MVVLLSIFSSGLPIHLSTLNAIIFALLQLLKYPLYTINRILKYPLLPLLLLYYISICRYPPLAGSSENFSFLQVFSQQYYFFGYCSSIFCYLLFSTWLIANLFFNLPVFDSPTISSFILSTYLFLHSLISFPLFINFFYNDFILAL